MTGGELRAAALSPGAATHLVRWLPLAAIRAYQLLVAPLLGPACRYEPTCSRYTEQAIRRYGVLIGLRLGARRILRCHPLGGSGYDPVP